MRITPYLKPILAAIIIFSFFISLAISCDDEDLSFDLACSTIISYRYNELIAALPAFSWAGYSKDPVSSEQIILYIERQEKSPPGFTPHPECPACKGGDEWAFGRYSAPRRNTENKGATAVTPWGSTS